MKKSSKGYKKKKENKFSMLWIWECEKWFKVFWIILYNLGQWVKLVSQIAWIKLKWRRILLYVNYYIN